MNIHSSMTVSELPDPVGNHRAVYAAISIETAAVYFGMGGLLNARAKNEGSSNEQLADIIKYHHRSNLKNLLTSNTLVFVSELNRVPLLIKRYSPRSVLERLDTHEQFGLSTSTMEVIQ